MGYVAEPRGSFTGQRNTCNILVEESFVNKRLVSVRITGLTVR